MMRDGVAAAAFDEAKRTDLFQPGTIDILNDAHQAGSGGAHFCTLGSAGTYDKVSLRQLFGDAYLHCSALQ